MPNDNTRFTAVLSNPFKTFAYGEGGGPGVGGHMGPLWQIASGKDMRAPVGTPVYSAFDGTIAGVDTKKVGVTTGSTFGAQIHVKTADNKLQAFYTHIDELDAAIKKGAKVRRGDLLGRIAKWQGGTHLHFAMAVNPPMGAWKGVSPVPFLSATKGKDESLTLVFDGDAGTYSVGEAGASEAPGAGSGETPAAGGADKGAGSATGDGALGKGAGAGAAPGGAMKGGKGAGAGAAPGGAMKGEKSDGGRGGASARSPKGMTGKDGEDEAGGAEGMGGGEGADEEPHAGEAERDGEAGDGDASAEASDEASNMEIEDPGSEEGGGAEEGDEEQPGDDMEIEQPDDDGEPAADGEDQDAPAEGGNEEEATGQEAEEATG